MAEHWINIGEGKAVRRVNIKHLMRKYRAFGISESVINELEADGITDLIFIYDGESGVTTHKAKLQQFKDSNKMHVFGEDDLQYFVPVKEMS
jgi:hypothetical protein